MRTWNDDCRFWLVGPIVGRDISRVLDRDVFEPGEPRRLGDRLDGFGRVEAFLYVGLWRKVAVRRPIRGATSSCTTGIGVVLMNVMPVTTVWFGTPMGLPSTVFEGGRKASARRVFK
jgi:hypothetical protein